MKETFAKFPEVLLLDGTYSTNNCGMPLYSFVAEDGYGQGQIVGMFLLNGEGNDQISSMVEIFHTANTTVAQMQTVMTDKDFTEISAVESLLPRFTVLKLYRERLLRYLCRLISSQKRIHFTGSCCMQRVRLSLLRLKMKLKTLVSHTISI